MSARGNWKGNEATKATVGEKSEAAEAPRDPGAVVGGVGGGFGGWWIVDSGCTIPLVDGGWYTILYH